MTRIHATSQNHRWISFLMPSLAWLGRGPRRDQLDVRGLSEHLKRDMGFLDGNDPSGKHR
jgi:hypothetical protein